MKPLKTAVLYNPSKIRESEMKAALEGMKEFGRFGLESEAIRVSPGSLMRVKRSGILGEATKTSEMHLRPSDLIRPRTWEIITGFFAERDRLGIAITDSILFGRDESVLSAVRRFYDGCRIELGMGFSLRHLESAGAGAEKFRLSGNGKAVETVLPPGGEPIRIKSREMETDGTLIPAASPEGREEEHFISLLLGRNFDGDLAVHSEIERKPERKEERALGLSAPGAGGMVSISRLREVCYRTQLAEAIRLATMHEMGHVLGKKEHCANDNCLMQKNEDHMDFIQNFVEKGRTFCPECTGIMVTGASKLSCGLPF